MKFFVTILVLNILVVVFALGCDSNHGGHSHYAGQEKREIKALSDEDIKNYLAGNGMGFAKTAELNGFPGPKHILENEEKLELTGEQKKKVETSFKAMKAEAIELGKEIVEKEKEFDKLFGQNKIDNEGLTEKTQEIARLKGNLRNVHLRTHLEMKKVLSDKQVKKYNELRGYSN